MKNRLNTLLSILFAITIVAWYGCNKTDTTPPVIKPDPLEEKVTASINGRVIDETGKPVSNAAVQSGTSATSTDINGAFRFNNIQLSKNAGYVQVEKDGYFKSGRTIFSSTGNVNNIEIKLIPKTEVGNFQVAAGGNVNIASGTSVNFPANGIINKATNTAYSGTVKVFGAYLNPEDPNLALIMPGNLTGITTENEQKILQTYGMIVAELEGSNGEKLNLASGKTATITLPIPSSLQANAPATIPLWYFSDSLGIWKEEGTATKQGNAYTGTVSHFSFWNCDVPANFVNLKMTLKNQNQELLPGYRVLLINKQNNSHSFGYTDSSGTVNGPVPINAPIEMAVYNKCGTELYNQTIGPFASATDLGVVTVNTPAPGTIVVSGSVAKCNQSAVANGIVDFYLDGIGYRAAVNNGNYSITIQRCATLPSTLTIVASDIDASQQGNVSELQVTSGSYTANLVACGTSTLQFINFSIGGNIFNFIPPNDSLTAWRNGSTTNIDAYRQGRDSANYQYTSFKLAGNAAPGTYSMSTNTFILSKAIPSTIEYKMEGAINITITEYGGPGEYVAGSFTGNFRERYSNAVVSGTCSFRIRRF